jgi:hypothetical protein
MGALAVAILYLAGLGALHLPEVATQGLFVALIYGVPIGLLPALATGIVHLVLERRSLTRPRLIWAVCGAGVAITVAFFLFMLTGSASTLWSSVLTMGAVAALASLAIAWLLTSEAPSAT